MEAILNLLKSHEVLQRELDELVAFSPESTNVVRKDWEKVLVNTPNYKTWASNEFTKYLSPKRSISENFEIQYCRSEKRMDLIVSGTFIYQRKVKRDGKEKRKDENRLEYHCGCPALDKIKTEVATQMNVPVHTMILLFLTDCRNCCELCSRTPNLPKNNKYCLKYLRLYDADRKIKPVSSAYLDAYYSGKPFVAIAKLNLYSFINAKDVNTVKLSTNCKYMLIIPEYVINQLPSLDEEKPLIPDDLLEHEDDDVDDDDDLKEEYLLPQSLQSTKNEVEYKVSRKKIKLDNETL